MASALTPPVLVAALVVGLAAVAKLRAPAAAGEALATLGIPGLRRAARERAVRCLALGELALAAAAAVAGATGLLITMAALYLAFAATTVMLARRQAECGCFGGSGAPASGIGVALNLAFAAVCLLGAAAGSPRAARVFDLPPWQAPIAAGSIAAATLAAALAYTVLPRAWRAWSGG